MPLLVVERSFNVSRECFIAADERFMKVLMGNATSIYTPNSPYIPQNSKY